VTFEVFIYAVYTGAVKIDDAPDNEEARRARPQSGALAQLGQYLEEQRPELSAKLLDQMAEFYSVKSNQTFIRGMFLESVRRLTTAAPPAVDDEGTAATTGGRAETAKTSRNHPPSTVLDNEAIGAASLARRGSVPQRYRHRQLGATGRSPPRRGRSVFGSCPGAQRGLCR